MSGAGFESGDLRFDSDGESTLNATAGRSSLGIMDINNMNDLSGSILHIESDLHSTPFIPSDRPRVIDPNLPRPSFPQTPDLPSQSDVNNCFSSDSAKTVTPVAHNDTDTPKASHQPDFLGSDSLQPRNLRDDFQTVVRNPRMSALNREDLPVQETSPDLPPSSKAGVLSMALALGGADSADDDASVHEVELNESDLKQFDDDFSDIGDFDVTAGEESLDIFHGQMKDQLSLIGGDNLGELASLGKTGADSGLPPSMQASDAHSAAPPPLSVSWWDQNKHTMDSIFFRDPSSLAEPQRQEAEPSIMTTPRSSDIFGNNTNMSVNSTNIEQNQFPRSAQKPKEPLAVVSPANQHEVDSLHKSESLTNFEAFEAECLSKSEANASAIPISSSATDFETSTMTFLRSLGLMKDGYLPKPSTDQSEVSEVGQSPHVTFAQEMSELTDNVSKMNSKFFAASDTITSMAAPTEISIATDCNSTLFGKEAVQTESHHTDDSMRDSGVENHDATTSPTKKSLVYQTEDGHWVTDLAFERPLGDPFDAPPDLSAFGSEALAEGVDFMSPDEALAKLDEDQEAFEGENVFTEDDAMSSQGVSLMDDSDSWVLKSHLTLTRPSWIKNGSREGEEEEDSQDYFRISIGQFMQKRTQPLGSLDGDERFDRPTFGRQIKSPPTKPAQSLVDVPEEKDNNLKEEEKEKEADHGEISQIENPSAVAEKSESVVSDDTLLNKTQDPSIDLSSVVHFITSAPSDAEPKELAQLIMRMSQKKAKEKKKCEKALKGDKSQLTVRMPSCGSIGRELSPILSEDVSVEEKKATVAKKAEVKNAESLKKKSAVRIAESVKKKADTSKIPIRVSKKGDEFKRDVKGPAEVAKVLLGQGQQHMASTPKRQEIADNINTNETSTQESLSILSRISPSPKDKIDSQDPTLWSGGPSPADANSKADSESDKNTENNCGYFQSKAATQPVESYQHNLLPVSMSQKPTLLTDRPLSATDFARQYMPKERSHNSWPAAHGNSPPARLSDNTPPTSIMRAAPPSSWTTPLMATSMVTSVEAPQQVIMPDVCCVGLSTHCSLPISNPSKHWFQAHLKVVALSVDGQDVNPDVQLPFVLKDRSVIGPSSKDDVKVIFAPQSCGVYVAKVHLTVTPMIDHEPAATAYLPKLIVLQGIAEKPLIQINTGSPNSVLKFGALSWGYQKSLTLKLLNRGRAKVPVRLSLQSHHSSQPFSFERYSSSSGAPSPLSSSSSSSCSAVPSITHITLLPSLTGGETEVAEITVFFQAPPLSGVSGSLPEEFTGSIEIQVDSPCSFTPLGSVPIQAMAGQAKLHTPCDLETISLHACVGGCQSHSIPLRNAGNIPMDLSLEMTHWSDVFTVVPDHVTIDPGSEIHVNVKFRPNAKSVRKLESLLLLCLEPDGPGYQIQLRGTVDAPECPSTAPSRQTRTPIILSNKHFLAYGGIDIGKSLLQSVVLKHKEDRVLRISLSLRGATNVFKMQVSEGKEEQVSINREILLKPNEEYQVHVLFRPAEVKGYQGLLVIRPVDSPLKHSITLGGYGGVSHLVLEGVLKGSASENSYWTKVNGMTPNTPLTLTATVANTGVRSGYFKAVSFRDLTCKHLIPKTTVRIEPAQMVLPAGFKQELKVTLTPSEKEVKQCSNEAAIVACVALFCGDEYSRIKYKEAFGAKGAVDNLNLSEDNPVRSLDFLSVFLNEDPNIKVSDVKSSARDFDLFYSTMSKITLTLVGQPPSPEPFKSQTMPAPTPVSIAPAVKSQSSNSSTWQPATWEIEKEKDKWSARPDSIVLTAPLEDGDPEVKRIQLINYASDDLHFDLSWPGHFILVTPESGVLKARNHTVLNVSAKSSITQLPWKGSLVVLCGGETKIISLRIEAELQSKENTEPQSQSASHTVSIPRDPLSTLHNTELRHTRDDMSHIEQPLLKDRTQFSINDTELMSKILDIHPRSLEFAECDSKCQTMRIKIKNLDTVAHNISIVKPKRPFRVRTTNFHILPCHYVRLPVEFNREGFKPGYYQGVFVLRVEGQSEAMQISLSAEI